MKSIAAGTYTDWQKLMYQTAHKTDQNITVSGGSDGNTYSLGGGYYKETAVLPGQDFTRYSIRGTIDTRIGNRVKVGLNTLNTYGIIDGSQFIPGLKYRINLGLSYTQEEDDEFQGSDTKANPSFFRPGKGNTASVNQIPSYGYTAENLLTYDKTIASKHRINFTGLYSIQEFHQHNTYVSKDSIDQDFVQFYNLGQSSTTPAPVISGSELSWALISYMARVNYVYDNRFMLTLTGRMDGSSRLAPGHKWHRYPAVSAGWDILSESFMKGADIFSSLKLRVGFGQTSNQSIQPYASLGNVSNSNNVAAQNNVSQGSTGTTIRYNYGSTVVTGYNVLALPNPNLDWEYTKTINLGLDFGILRNRITGAFEYYHEHTDKILYNITLPATSGVAGPYSTNIGQMQNWGLEFSVSSVNIQTRSGFSWTTDLNLFFNRNKLLALSSNVKQDIANQLFVGYSMSSIYDYKKLGIWQQSAVNSLYAGMRFNYGPEPALAITVMCTDEFTGGDQVLASTGGQYVRSFALYGGATPISPSDGSLLNQWNNNFNLINQANAVVQYAPTVAIDSATKISIVAQARFLRGLFIPISPARRLQA